MLYLNLGCGTKTHPDWINVDMHADDQSVIECNFLHGIPFASDHFDVVYHSHVLEHFPQAEGAYFVQECYRILKPGGVIRMVFPNLERIASEYINNLRRIDAGEVKAEADYDWIMLEMYDQTVRNEHGGQMGRVMADKAAPSKAYIDQRLGMNYQHPTTKGSITQEISSEIARLKAHVQQHDHNAKGGKSSLKDRALVKLLSEQKKKELATGAFRFGGEIHQWMYDRFSAKRLLEKTGFKNVVLRTATESYIQDWSRFGLDNPIEQASLFIEAIK